MYQPAFNPEAIRQAIDKLPGSRADQARALGISYATLTNYRNMYRQPSYETVIRIARKTDTDIETLYAEQVAA